jgi:hypothetical protein
VSARERVEGRVCRGDRPPGPNRQARAVASAAGRIGHQAQLG